MKQTLAIIKKERAILDTCLSLSNQLESLKELDPIIAGKVFKQAIQYLQEKNETKVVFTIEELVNFGYLPS